MRIGLVTRKAMSQYSQPGIRSRTGMLSRTGGRARGASGSPARPEDGEAVEHREGLGVGLQDTDPLKHHAAPPERAECPLVAIQTDAGVSAKMLARPALTAALADLDAGKGSIPMVSKLDRLSRSVHDASGLFPLGQQAGWDLVALDASVDTTTPSGPPWRRFTACSPSSSGS
jgi:hypothetical protein